MKRLVWFTLIFSTLILTGCSNQFDPNTASFQYELPWHKSGVSTIDFSPDGRLMATGSNDGRVRIFVEEDMVHPIQVQIGTEMWVYDLAFSPDGKRIAVATDQMENNLHLLDANTGEVVQTLPGHQNVTALVAFSHDGGTIITGGNWQGEYYLWSASDGTLKKTLEHLSNPQSIVVSPDGSWFASGTGYDGASVRQWSLPDGELIRELTEINGDARSLAVSPDGKVLACGSYGQISLWDAKTGALLKTITTDSEFWVYCVEFSPDGKWMVSGDAAGWMKVFSTADWTRASKTLAHSNTISDLAFSPDGEKLYSVGQDNAVKAWFAIKKKYVLF